MKNLLLVLLLWAINIENISGTNRRRRLAGAEKCDIKAHPSMVSITANKTKKGWGLKYEYCTGVLIGMKWFLSSGDAIYNHLHSWNAEPVAGVNRELDFETGEVREIEELHFYRDEHQSITGLILVELKTPFEKSDTIKPANLPRKANMVDGCPKLTAVGWGKNSSDDGLHKKLTEQRKAGKGDYLKCGNAKLIKNEESCGSYPEFLCCQFEDKSQLCAEDDGLGIFCNDTLVGILNPKGLGSCGEINRKGSFFNISHYMDSIHEIAGIEIPSDFYQNLTAPAVATHQSNTHQNEFRTTKEYKRQPSYST